MGQYYKIVNIDKKEYMESNSGVKLMEWSYNRNELILNLMKKLANEWKGDRVYVVGDYAVSDDVGNDSYEFKTLEKIEKDLDIYNKEDNRGYRISIYGYTDDNFKKISLEKLEKEEYKYIYNHNKKQFINIDHCPLAWLYKEKNTYFSVKIAPISLLLALGNGMGGGDYFSNNQKLVGNFIEDVQNLEITKEPLNNDYEELRPEFYEGEYIPYNQIKNYIKLEEEKLKIAREITKFLVSNDKENFKQIYKSQKDATERISWYLDTDYKREIERLDNIISKNESTEIKETGSTIIEKINNYILERKVRSSISKVQSNLEESINNKDYINEVYKKIFKELNIENIEDISTDNEKTTIIFESTEKHEITTKDLTNVKEFLENSKYINKLSKEQKEVIKFTEIGERIPKHQKNGNLFYYEYRENEGERTIEKNVWVDYAGTLVTNKDILNGKEYVNYNDIFNNPKLLLLDDSDLQEKVEKQINIEDEIQEGD